MLKAKIPDTVSAPLTAFQAAVLVAHELDPGSHAYTLAIPIRMRGPLDNARLRRAIEQLHERHGVLRTTYHGRGMQRVQRLSQTFELDYREADATGGSREQLLSQVQVDARRAFDLTRSPSQVDLYRCARDEHVLLWRLSHISSDLGSVDIIIDELFRLYAGETLPAIRASYLDFVEKHQKFRESAAAEAMGATWERLLSGVSSGLDFPLDRPRPALRAGTTGAAHSFHLDAELTGRLHALSSNYFHTLLAAWFTLLFRLTQREDLLCGVPASLRGVQFKGVVGDFSNLLPIRVQAGRRIAFRQFSENISAALRDAVRRRDYPYLDLLQRLNRRTDRSRLPLCESDFGYLRMRRVPEGAALAVHGAPWSINRAGLQVESFPFSQVLGQYDINSWVCETQGQTWGEFKYTAELFDASTVARLGDCFVELLRGIANRPDALIGELPFVPEEQRRRNFAINCRSQQQSREMPVHQLFAMQADRTPDAPAVRTPGASLSYRELDERSNRLAHRLIAAGIGPERTVAVCLERSLDLVVTLLAVLKAGGAYVPLDAAYPMDRLVHVLGDADPDVLLTQSSLVSRLPAPPGKLLLLEPVMMETGNADAVPERATPDHPAYLIYTSGSTGRPKGVEVLHRNLANFLAAMRKRPGLSAHDTLLAVTTLSFDIAALEIFLPLVTGAQVVLAPPEATGDGAQLAALLRAERISVLQATPATWRMLIDSGWRGGPLKALCGGEQLTRELANELCARTDELWNLYGPTETTVWSMRGRVEAGEGPVSLGEPIENTSVYVTDENLEPVPAGVVGELLIGGAGVARGYRNLPDITAERFVHAAFGSRERLYRTGDRVRQRPDGAIDYVGRNDHQVKIRGFRIELGEIESAVRRHPDVAEVVAAVWGEGLTKRLAAYVVPRLGTAPGSTEIKAMIRRVLPEYAVPHWVVTLAALPLTPNGKVDRQALPAPDAVSEARTSSVLPRNETETIIAKAFRKALELDREVGIDEDFFAIGGDSLRAVQLLGALDAEFDRQLPLATLFTNTTVERVAAALGADALDTHSLLVPLQTGGTGSPLFCIHPMGGHVFCYSDLAQALAGLRPVFGLRARGVEGEAEPHTDVESMAACYVETIRTIQPEGPIALCGWSMGGMIALEIAIQLRSHGQHVALLAVIDTGWPKVPRPVLDRIRRRGLMGMLSVPGERLRRYQDRKREGRRQEPLAVLRRAAEFAQMTYAPRSNTEHVLLVSSQLQMPTTEANIAEWRRRVSRLETMTLQGGHWDMLKRPVVSQLAAELQRRLAAQGH